EGEDLERTVVEQPLPVGEACHYVLQACKGLANAHALGLVHGDLKPSNLFLNSLDDGSVLVKVLDFGFSKGAKAPVATAAYTSPEQMLSPRGVDARADVWSLGVVLYELLSTSLPFSGGSRAALQASVTGEEPPPLRAI